MSIGRKNQRVTFQTNTPTRDSGGSPVDSWANTFTDWAEVVPKKGSEKYEASQLAALQQVKLNMRFRTNITRQMRFIVGSQFYNIDSIIEVSQQKASIIEGTLIAVT